MNRLLLAFLIVGLAAPGGRAGGPPSADEVRRQALLWDELTKAVAAETTAKGKLAVLSNALTAAPVDFRRRVLDAAAAVPDADVDAFLTPVLTDDPDAGLRSQAATLLGRHGSEKCLAVLATAAATDKTTDCEMGCIRGRSSARRAATFAVADLAARHPKLAADAEKKLRGLTPAFDPKDNESLADARVQALYQVTRDETLLRPFYDRLKSTTAKERENGVVAFRFLKLRAAPPELVAMLKDANADVRLWTPLVLGEIGDAKAGAALMAAAGDGKEVAGFRCNCVAALGRMKHAPAADLLRKLQADADPTVAACAKQALERLADKTAP